VNRLINTVLLGSIALFIAWGCEQKSATSSQSSPSGGNGSSAQQKASPALPATLFLTAAPADARDVKAAKTGLKVGDEVTLRGRIGGSSQPFVDGRAVLTIVDKALPACSDNPDDNCATPWDYCCESRADILANSATVQVVDQAGQPLKIGLENAQGLNPLREIVVVGKVAQRDDAGVLVVNATGLFVAGG
jgi:hypothetical protein